MLDRDRRRRFLGDGQAQAQRLGRRLGIGPLVALPPGAVVVDEIRVAGPTGGDQGCGDHCGIQTAGQLRRQPAVIRNQSRRRSVHDGFQSRGIVVPPTPTGAERRRAPDLQDGGRIAGQGQSAGSDRRQPSQPKAVGDDRRVVKEGFQSLPVDPDAIRPHRIQFRRRLAGGEGQALCAPPDAVQRPGGITKQAERVRGVVDPGQHIAAPAMRRRLSCDLRRRPAFSDQRGQGARSAPPVPDQDMASVNLDRFQPRSGRQPHFKPIDVERRPPALPAHRRHAGFERRNAIVPAVAPVDQHIAVGVRRRRRHRLRIGVKA